LWAAALAVCAGTALGSATSIRLVGAAALALGLPLLFVRRRPGVTLIGLVVVVGGVAVVNAQVRSGSRGPLAEIARDVPRCAIEGRVIEDIGGLGSLVAIDVARCGEWSRHRLGVASLAEPISDPGSTFEAEGWLVPLGTDGFDLARRRVGAQAVLHPSTIEVVDPPRSAHAVAARVRRGLRDATTGIDARSGAVLRGLTIGDTADIPQPTIDAFRASGLSHVLAVSGSNLAIVLGAVLVLLGRVGLRSRITLGFTALALFVLIVGPDASVLRAGAMGAIGLACLAYGRTSEPLAALALAVIAVLAIRPAMLFSVGMHLSVAATAGIVVLAEPLTRRFGWLPRPLRLLVAASLAAQLAVTPILVLSFGEISLVSPVANVLALPAVAPVTVLGLAAGVVAIAWAPLGALAVRVIEPALGWIVTIAHASAAPDWAVVEVSGLWTWLVLAATAALGRGLLGDAAEPE